MSKQRKVCIWLVLPIMMLSIAGCSKISNLDKMLTLKELADFQEATDAHIEEREANFQTMLADIASGQVDELSNKQDVLDRYGEPVYIKQVSYQEQMVIMWMYRLPVKFMDSDQVLFYFDDSNRLVTHEVRGKDK